MAVKESTGGRLRPALHAALALVLLVMGLLGARAIVESAPTAARADHLPGPRPIPVESYVLRLSEVPRTIPATGTLEAADEAVLASELGGRVVYVAAGLRDGRFCAAGEVLLRVDSASLEAELRAQATSIELSDARLEAAEKDLVGATASLKALEAQRELLQADEDRWAGLGSQGKAERARVDLAKSQRLGADAAVSDAQRGLDAIRSSIVAARLEIRLAGDRKLLLETQKAKAELKAPFAGRFSASKVPAIGTMLVPMGPVGSLLDETGLRLVTEVHEDDLAALSTRSQAMAAPLSRPGMLLEGSVTGLGARVDPVTRCVRVEALFPTVSPFEGFDNVVFDAAAPLPSGTFARVELQGTPFRDALWVSESWLTYRDGEAVAFVVKDAAEESGPVAERRAVTLLAGMYDGGRIITAGLVPGERIVTSGLPLLDDGAVLVLSDTTVSTVPVMPAEPSGEGDH